MGFFRLRLFHLWQKSSVSTDVYLPRNAKNSKISQKHQKIDRMSHEQKCENRSQPRAPKNGGKWKILIALRAPRFSTDPKRTATCAKKVHRIHELNHKKRVGFIRKSPSQRDDRFRRDEAIILTPSFFPKRWNKKKKCCSAMCLRKFYSSCQVLRFHVWRSKRLGRPAEGIPTQRRRPPISGEVGRSGGKRGKRWKRGKRGASWKSPDSVASLSPQETREEREEGEER